MEKDSNVIVQEYITSNKKDSKVNIDSLISRFKNRNSNFVILKGAKLLNGKSYIVYIIGKDDYCNILENMYRNGSKCNTRITKKNRVKNSYFDFSVWSIMRIGNGQITGSNMNMLNDDEKYKCYKITEKR